MLYTQQELSEGVSRFRANPQEARIPPPPSCSPPRFTQPPPSNKHYVLSEVELATFRTQLCENHQRNRCAHPDACPHSHCMTWQRRNPYEIIYDPHLCPGIEFRRSNSKMSLVRHCTRGRSCAYAHSKEEELYHPLKYKTKLCTVFPKCDRHYCPFAHSAEEMRHPFNNPLIHYIWGSSAVLDCSDPNDTAHRWASSPLTSSSEPFLFSENVRLPSIPREPLQQEPTQFSQRQQHFQVHQQHFQHQQQLQLQPPQQQNAQEGVQQGWSHDPYQPPHMQSQKQLHSVSLSTAAPPPLCSLTAQQEYHHRQGFPLGVAKQISMRGTTKQAVLNASVKSSVSVPANASQNTQATSHLGRGSERVPPSKSERKARGIEPDELAGEGRKSAAVQESLLGHPLEVQKFLLTASSANQEEFRGAYGENHQRTLPASSEAASATTTTASTDLQDLLDSESIRRALIMTLAQQLIGPQVNQLSVDQVLIVLDLAVKLAAQLQPTTPTVSVFSPSPAEELLRFQQTESDSPHQGTSMSSNTELLASNSATSQQAKLNGSGSTDTVQSDNLSLQQQQQQYVARASTSASQATGSAVKFAAQSATTDNSLADTTSLASFNEHAQDIDPIASLAATHALIEQLRKLSLLDAGEEVSRSCLSPAPSLEEADTSSLSIVRGSSTAVWSTSTSPIVGGHSDLSSRYTALSARYGDLVPTTAITAAATTFASASSNADEASLCACPSLTISQDLNTNSDKHHHLVHISRTASAVAESNLGETSGCASAALFYPPAAREKTCASPVEGLLPETQAGQAKRGRRSGESLCAVPTQTSTKTQPSFASFLGGKSISPCLRGLLPSPATHGATCNEEEAPADFFSVSRPPHLMGPKCSRAFGCEGAKPLAVGSFPPPPPVTVKQLQDTGLQKRPWLSGTLTSARKLLDPFSPQLTTCSHSPSAGQFSSPQYCMGGSSSTEPTPAYGVRLPDSNSNCSNNFGQSVKGSGQAASRNAVHDRKNCFSEGQYRQRAKVHVSEASA